MQKKEVDWTTFATSAEVIQIESVVLNSVRADQKQVVDFIGRIMTKVWNKIADIIGQLEKEYYKEIVDIIDRIIIYARNETEKIMANTRS